MGLGLRSPGKPVLRGERVVLRPIGVADAETMFAGLADSEAIRLTGTHAAFTRADVEAHCARVAAVDDRWDYAIVADGEMVGEVVLNELDRDNRCANIRIAIWGAAARGRGLGEEAMRLLTDFAIDQIGLHRVELGVYAFNPRAIRCYEKVGFVQEGTRRAALLWDGAWIDQHVMAVLASEWPGKD